MIYRTITNKIEMWSRQYPVITITGPRQSGKSTLSKHIFPHKPYVSLEDTTVRQRAIEDPVGFLARYPDGVILDEIQRAPLLPSYIQTIVDRQDSAGMFVLTGSQQFELMESVSQSLAGRTAIARLLPFSYQEAYGADRSSCLDSILYTGFYPRIHDKELNPTEALSFYVSTYLERDIRQILNVKDVARFETFLKLLAGRSGQVCNASSLSADCGVSHNTVLSWIGVLEQSMIVYRLKPYHRNLGKRLLKSPKLYFLDSGLLCYLLNIHNVEQLAVHPMRGQIFESFVISELLKNRYNQGLPDTMLFYRDQKGNEVDVILECGINTILLEIKSSATFHADYVKALGYLSSFMSESHSKVVVLGSSETPYRYKDYMIYGYSSLDAL